MVAEKSKWGSSLLRKRNERSTKKENAVDETIVFVQNNKDSGQQKNMITEALSYCFDETLDIYGLQRNKGSPLQDVVYDSVGGNHDQSEDDGRDDHGNLTDDEHSSMLPSPLEKDRQEKVIYRQFGEVAGDVLEIQSSHGIPEPATEHDVVIRVQASTISYNDCIMRRGICFKVLNPTALPVTPGHDVVGTIVRRGSKARGFLVGERVAALVQKGGNARYASVPVKSLVTVPSAVDAGEAASVVSTYMTAYQAILLVTKDKVSLRNKRILITEGLEPVGQALIQLCYRAGAKEVYATAPDHRHRYITTVLGAYPLPTHPEDWLPLVRDEIDVVFDGTCDDGYESSHAALCSGGILVCLGMSALLDENEGPGFFGAPLNAFWTRLRSQMFMTRTINYCILESFQKNPDKFKTDLEVLLQLLQKRYIRPHIAKRVTLNEVAEAQESIEHGQVRGEVVCLPWKSASNSYASRDIMALSQWRIDRNHTRSFSRERDRQRITLLRNTRTHSSYTADSSHSNSSCGSSISDIN